MSRDPGLDLYYKWMYYSTYHPSADLHQVHLDWKNKKPLRTAYEEAGIEWPSPYVDHHQISDPCLACSIATAKAEAAEKQALQIPAPSSTLDKKE